MHGVTSGNENEIGRSRVGRPRGSAGHQAERLKFRLASLVVLGKRNIEIATALDVSAKTVRLWLQHPDVRAEIRELEEELHHSTERLFAGLFRASVKRLKKILRHGDEKAALRAIEMIWTATGRLPQRGNSETGMYNRQRLLNQPNVFIHDEEDAHAALQLLKEERRRQQRCDHVASTPLLIPARSTS